MFALRKLLVVGTLAVAGLLGGCVYYPGYGYNGGGTMAAAIMEVRITGVAQSLPMATAGTAAGGTVTVIGIAERR